MNASILTAPCRISVQSVRYSLLRGRIGNTEMAVSKTTFAQRMDKINKGQTTSWTVPGEGLATVRDERSFLKKSPIKMSKKSKQKKRKEPTTERFRSGSPP